MIGWVEGWGRVGGEEKGLHPGPARPGGDPCCPVDSWGRQVRAEQAHSPRVATAAALVQSWVEEAGAGAGAGGGGKGGEGWEAALGRRSGPGAHPGSPVVEAGEGG